MSMVENTFADHTAIVTGAGEGIGLEIAKQLVQQGARVIVNDIDPVKTEQAIQTIDPVGNRSFGCAGDVADVTVVYGLVEAAVTHFDGVDMVVCNAGVTLWNSFFDYKPVDFERVLSVNLGGSFFLAQAAARQMRQQGRGGRIVFMSSVSGHQAIEYLSAYAMTKAALEMLARQLIIELSPFNITINTVAPGATVTPRNLADDPNYEAVWGKVTPTGRPAFVEDIAHAVLFMLSPLSSQITGQSLVIDGGWTSVSQAPALDFVEQKKE